MFCEIIANIGIHAQIFIHASIAQEQKKMEICKNCMGGHFAPRVGQNGHPVAVLPQYCRQLSNELCSQIA